MTGEPCPWCGRPVERRELAGRPPVYCGVACRQRSYELRKLERQLVEAGWTPPIAEGSP